VSAAPYKLVVNPDVSAPSALVDLTTIKGFLRLRTAATDEDTLLTRLEKSARSYVEGRARVVLTATQFILTSPYPTFDEPTGLSIVKFPRTPVRSIESVKVKRSGTQVTLTAGTDYESAIRPPSCQIRLIDLTGDFDGRTNDAIEIKFTAGFDSSTPGSYPLPVETETAMLNLIAFWYENRGSGTCPTWIDDLIDSAYSGI
jgi:uncharacterized phiE125 gp8 family phage protein